MELLTNSKNHYDKITKQLQDKRKKGVLICKVCRSTNIQNIDSYWECSRPYTFYMCLRCKKIYMKYDDENFFRTIEEFNKLVEELKKENGF